MDVPAESVSEHVRVVSFLLSIRTAHMGLTNTLLFRTLRSHPCHRALSSEGIPLARRKSVQAPVPEDTIPTDTWNSREVPGVYNRLFLPH